MLFTLCSTITQPFKNLSFLGAHQYLSQDLGTERLSAPNQHKRQHYIQAMVGFIQRIQSLQGPPGPPIIQPRMNTPGKIPPQIQRYGGPPPPTFVPPIIPGPKPTVEELEDPQDVYEVPENKQEEPQVKTVLHNYVFLNNIVDKFYPLCSIVGRLSCNGM